MPKRRIIIRESEITKMSKRSKSWYKAIIFTPLTRTYFEKRITHSAVRGKAYLADQYSLYNYPHAMLRRLTMLKLHDDRYPSWLIKYNERDELVVRPTLRQPDSRLGIATYVEHDK